MSVLWHPTLLLCLLLFTLHQWTQKIMAWSIPWADNNLDCLLCMPIFLSMVLIERRWIFSLKNYRFSPLETTIMVVVLALIFEEGFPRWSTQFTKDYWDYLSYAIGGLFFYFFINQKI